MEYALQEINKLDESADNPEATSGTDDILRGPIESTTYDYFISYSHRHTVALQVLVDTLKIRNPAATIFDDRDMIPAGGLWIKKILDAIQRSKNVGCILMPEYSQSYVCWHEFQCAYVVEKQKKQ
jgi:hypothetical protein